MRSVEKINKLASYFQIKLNKYAQSVGIEDDDIFAEREKPVSEVIAEKKAAANSALLNLWQSKFKTKLTETENKQLESEVLLNEYYSPTLDALKKEFVDTILKHPKWKQIYIESNLDLKDDFYFNPYVEKNKTPTLEFFMKSSEKKITDGPYYSQFANFINDYEAKAAEEKKAAEIAKKESDPKYIEEKERRQRSDAEFNKWYYGR